MTDETIAQVVKDGLCTGCGTCVALCPNDAIKLTINENKGIYIPKLNEEKCKGCGICSKVCPGHEVDFKELNLEIFGKEPKDVLIGNYINCYIGHATDYKIRYNSASGGLVTQLLIFALEEGIIDGALVVKMKKDNPLEPEPFIARTKEEIIEASKSKYCPVPMNVTLKEILKSKEEEKFAVVGLPCHIHGIRKAERMNKKLKEKIILHLGIFCKHTSNFLGTEFLLKKVGIKKEDVINLSYRGEGWPGSMKIGLGCSESGKLLLPLPDYWGFVGSDFFIPNRCILCSDQTCELSDISFGDAWLPELTDDKIGTSVLISRNKIGEELLQSAILKKRIELDKINSNKLAQSQGMMRFKKNDLKVRIYLFKLLGKGVPIYNSELMKPRLSAYLTNILIYLHIFIASKRYLRSLLKYVPFSVLKLYNLCIRIFSKI